MKTERDLREAAVGDDVMDLGDVLERLMPAIDALASAVIEAGGSVTVAAEVGGHLLVRRTGSPRFDVRPREPEDEAGAGRMTQSEFEGQEE